MNNARELEANGTTRNGTRALLLAGGLSARTGLIAVAVAGTGFGLFLGWDWLVGAGLAPILLAVLPCAAMCALGLCANRLGRKDACAGSGEGSAPRAPNGPVATLAADRESGSPPGRASAATRDGV